MASFLDPVKGFGVTFTTMFKKVTTEQYPEEVKATAPRYHGRHVLNRHPDGLEKCIGCELCAWACPADAIQVVGAENTPEARFSPGERYAQIYQINYLRCIFCGLCVEACPTEALLMTTEYELSSDSREALIYTKDQLIVDQPIVRHWETRREVGSEGRLDDGTIGSRAAADSASSGGTPARVHPDDKAIILNPSGKRSPNEPRRTGDGS